MLAFLQFSVLILAMLLGTYSLILWLEQLEKQGAGEIGMAICAKRYMSHCPFRLCYMNLWTMGRDKMTWGS